MIGQALQVRQNRRSVIGLQCEADLAKRDRRLGTVVAGELVAGGHSRGRERLGSGLHDPDVGNYFPSSITAMISCRALNPTSR